MRVTNGACSDCASADRTKTKINNKRCERGALIPWCGIVTQFSTAFHSLPLGRVKPIGYGGLGVIG